MRQDFYTGEEAEEAIYAEKAGYPCHVASFGEDVRTTISPTR